MAKKLMKGNEAIAEAAIQAGCRFFFGYPITPQNQIPEFMSKRMPKVDDGCFLQAESEVAAINMVYGAAGAGARVMTSSSSPGISLKQEGISYMVGAQLPAVIVNIVRGGPGLGSIQPAQSDYFQSTRGGGHGDYNMVVFSPASLQEAVDLTQKAFDVADRYRNPVIVLGDGMIGQMMEPVEIFPKDPSSDLPKKDWATVGWEDRSRARAVVNSLFIDPNILEKHNIMLQEKFACMHENEGLVEEYLVDDAELVLVAYGTTSRIAKSALRILRAEGMKVGLIRPITVWPFPEKSVEKAANNPATKAFLTIELSSGQMVEDVRLYANGKKPVEFFGRAGGMVPSVGEVVARIKAMKGGN